MSQNMSVCRDLNHIEIDGIVRFWTNPGPCWNHPSETRTGCSLHPFSPSGPVIEGDPELSMLYENCVSEWEKVSSTG